MYLHPVGNLFVDVMLSAIILALTQSESSMIGYRSCTMWQWTRRSRFRCAVDA